LELRRRAAELARQSDRLEDAARYLAEDAMNELNFGNCPQARQQIQAALSLHRHGAEAAAPYVFALCGDSTRAQALADELVKRFPLSTMVNNVTAPEIRAIVETHRGNPVKAIELLRSAEPFEKGRLGPAYARGVAYLKAKSGKEAAGEFQTVLARRGAEGAILYGPIAVHALSYLQLGRAYALSGDTEKARKTYQDFLALWKDADPDIPILRDAKAEYARLK
jgi:tetratricopeptide (TPR) repeat protein